VSIIAGLNVDLANVANKVAKRMPGMTFLQCSRTVLLTLDSVTVLDGLGNPRTLENGNYSELGRAE